MKTGSKLLSSMFLGLCALVGCADQAPGQTWLPLMGDGGTVSAVVTTDAVTYVEYTWYLAGCDQVSSMGPLIRSGNDFWYDFSIEHEYGVACPMYVIYEQSDVILGTLAPGTYTLITTSWNVPIGTNTFTISPALQPIGFDTNGSFQIQMSCGVTNVSYVLQCSSNLVDWISLSTNTLPTNSVGVPLTDNSAVLPGCRYYRVKCP